MRLIAAQPIKPYIAPQYLVEPTGRSVDAAELNAIRKAKYTIVERPMTVIGWGDHNAIIRVGDGIAPRYYLANLQDHNS